MSSYQKILVPTDFSAASAKAAARAKELASAVGASIDVVHVVDYVPPRYMTVTLPEEFSTPQSLMSHAGKHLAEWVTAQGLDVAEQIVVVGSPKHEIAAVAKKRGNDLIVIGSSGERAMHFLLGSTTQGVLHDAACDVLAVHP